MYAIYQHSRQPTSWYQPPPPPPPLTTSPKPTHDSDPEPVLFRNLPTFPEEQSSHERLLVLLLPQQQTPQPQPQPRLLQPQPQQDHDQEFCCDRVPPQERRISEHPSVQEIELSDDNSNFPPREIHITISKEHKRQRQQQQQQHADMSCFMDHEQSSLLEVFDDDFLIVRDDDEVSELGCGDPTELPLSLQELFPVTMKRPPSYSSKQKKSHSQQSIKLNNNNNNNNNDLSLEEDDFPVGACPDLLDDKHVLAPIEFSESDHKRMILESYNSLRAYTTESHKNQDLNSINNSNNKKKVKETTGGGGASSSVRSSLKALPTAAVYQRYGTRND